MKNLLFTILVLLVFPVVTNAATFVGGYPACITEEMLDEFISAHINKDQQALEYLMSHGCVLAKPGIRISVVDGSWTVSKVRAYVDDTSFILWTPNENISR